MRPRSWRSTVGVDNLLHRRDPPFRTRTHLNPRPRKMTQACEGCAVSLMEAARMSAGTFRDLDAAHGGAAQPGQPVETSGRDTHH